MEEPEPPPLPYDEDSRTSSIMASLKDSLLSKLKESNPSIDTDHASSYIQQRLPQLFPSFHTPTHPPYNSMIRRAITELNEGSGLSEKAISDFIVREFTDLPWAHVRVLGIQLKRLCEDGELVCNEGGRYVLVTDGFGGNGMGGGEGTVGCKGSRKRKRGKKRERKGRMDKCEDVERINELKEGRIIKEQVQVSELDGATNNEPSRVVECTEEQWEEAQQNPSIKRVEEKVGSEKGLLEGVGEQSQSQLQETGVIEQQAEALTQSEVEDSQIQQDSILHLETNCSSQPTALNFPDNSQQPLLYPISEGLPKSISSMGIESSLTRLQHRMPCHGPSESSLGEAAKMSASLSLLDVHEHKQDENPMFRDPENQTLKHQCRGRPRKSKPVADYHGGSLKIKKPNIKKTEKHPGIGRGRLRKLHGNEIEERWLSQTRGQGRGWGRLRKLHRLNVLHFKEQIQPQYQAQRPAVFPCSAQKETINSSQPTAPNIPVNLMHNFGQQLVVPISAGSPECIISTGTKVPTELQQISSDIDLGAKSKMEDSLAHMNVHDEQLRHCNQGRPEGNVDEKPMSGDPEQKPNKRARGRPRKSKTDANYAGGFSLPSDDGILNKHKLNPIIDKMENQHQYGRGRGQGRGRGRPPQRDRNTNQQEELLQQEDQAQQFDQHRGWGRPPKSNRNANQCEERLQQEDQVWQHGRGRGRGWGRSRKFNQNTIKCEEHLLPQDQGKGLPQLLPQVRSRGRGRPTKASTQCQQQLQTCQRLSQDSTFSSLSDITQLSKGSAFKSLSDIKQSIEQLRPQLCEVEGQQQGQGGDQNQGIGQERPPSPMLDANESEPLLQPQACEDQGGHHGRPPDQNQNRSLQQLRLEGRQLRNRTV